MPAEHRPQSLTRPEAFPAGLRVLVVDDDPTWLKILEKMLKKCSYEVTTCGLAREALDMLRERKDRFDIVISDVNMPDMDGFKLLEHVGLEMDLPVIMMSVDGETSRVMKGVQHGACDYLLKPVRMKELRNIWQHVYRKKIHEVKEIELYCSNEEIQMIKNGLEDFDDRQVVGGSDQNLVRKRKDVDNREHADQDCTDLASVKKARVVWSVDLHQKFVNAVNQIGFDKVGPKKILDLMNVPGLTRENVASHLQKYRLYLSRLQKQNEARTYRGNIQSDFRSKDQTQKLSVQSSLAIQQSSIASRYEERTFDGNMNSDFSSMDLPGSFGFQSSLSMQHNGIGSRHECTAQKIQAQSIIPDIQVDDLKTIVSLQVTDNKNGIRNDAPDYQKVNSVSQLGVILSLKGMKPNLDNKQLKPSTLKHQSWNGNIPVMQFMQKLSHEPCNLSEDHFRPPQPDHNHGIVDHLHSVPISRTYNGDKDTKSLSRIKPISFDNTGNHITTVAPVACTIDSVTVQVEHGVVNSQEFGAACKTIGSTSIKDFYYTQPSNCNLISPSQETSMKNSKDLVSLPEDLTLYSLQGYGCFENVGLNGVAGFEYSDSTALSEVHSNMYDGLGFNNCEYPYDSMEYSLLDDCLFT